MQRHWKVKYRDERGRIRRRKLITSAEEITQASKAHRWHVVSMTAGARLSC